MISKFVLSFDVTVQVSEDSWEVVRKTVEINAGETIEYAMAKVKTMNPAGNVIVSELEAISQNQP